MRSKDTVRQFKKQYGLKEPSVGALENIFGKQGFTVIRFNSCVNDPDVSTLIKAFKLEDMVARSNGFLYVDENYRLVFVNEKLSEDEMLLVLAHEEGHYYCGHTTQAAIVGRSVTEEYEANEFAHYLLTKSKMEIASGWIKNHRKALLISIALLITMAGGLFAYRSYRDKKLYAGEYYITMHGTKYHVKNCVTIEGHPIRRLKKEEFDDYEPCSVCMPEE